MFRRFKAFEASAVLQFKDPDTGMVYKADNLTELYKRIILYRQQNNLAPIEFLRETVENYICTMPMNANKCQGVDMPRSVMTYVKGGIQLFKNLLFKKYATQEIAEKRAAQCSKCEFNVFPDKGPFMAWADQIAIQCVGDRKVSVNDQLGNCDVCTCNLRSKVFFQGKLDPFTDEQLVKLRKVKCWQPELAGQK